MIATTMKIPASTRQATTGPYPWSTTTKAAAQRKPAAMRSASAATDISEACRSVEETVPFSSSTIRKAMPAPPSVEPLSAPRHPDQEAEAERKAQSRERALADDVFQSILDVAGGVLRRIHHRA